MNLTKAPVNAFKDRDHRQIAEAVNRLVDCVTESGEFTAALAGASTAGTYEIASQNSRYHRIGQLVFATVDITLAGSITGGGAGTLNLTGMPFTKRADHQPVGNVFSIGVDYTPGVQTVALFTSTANEVTSLFLAEVVDNASNNSVPISAVAANDRIIVSITYITSDP